MLLRRSDPNPSSADPKFLSETVLDAVDGVLQTTVAM